jgi:hypothetical protein
MESGLFEETAEVLVFEEAWIKVGVASAGIRDAAQESPARAKCALDLLKSMKWIHQMLKGFETND